MKRCGLDCFNSLKLQFSINDFLPGILVKINTILPGYLVHSCSFLLIEVKSGLRVRSQSLNVYIKKYSPIFAIRLSEKNFGWQNNIKSIPQQKQEQKQYLTAKHAKHAKKDYNNSLSCYSRMFTVIFSFSILNFLIFSKDNPDFLENLLR